MSNLSDEMKPSHNQVDTLSEIFGDIAKLSIITLDTDPRGIDKVKNIPVGCFVRLNDIKDIMEKYNVQPK